MNKVFTANVFLTTSREAIEKVFFGKSKIKTMKDRITALSKEDLKKSLIVTQENNPGLIEMDFSLGRANDGEAQLKLVFLETNTLFEEFYVSRSTESRILSNILTELHNNASVSGLDREMIERDLFDNNIGVLDSNKIFFSFGVGGNLSEWAGPFVMNLSRARSILSSDGIRQIELGFVGTLGYLSCNALEADVRNGLDDAVNRYSKILKGRKFIVSEAAREFTSIGQLQETVHASVRDITTEYIKKTTGSNNVIVLFPDFKKFLELYKREIQIRGLRPFTQPVEPSLLENTETIKERALLIGVYGQFFTTLGMSLQLKFEAGDTRLSTIPDEQFELNSKGVPSPVVLSMGVNSDNNEQERDNRIIPDAFAPLENLITGINENCLKLELSQDDFIVQFYEETDLKILKLWKKYGFIEDDKTVAYVFGSKGLVKSLLYLNGITTAFQAIESNIDREDLSLYNNQTYRLDYFNTFLKEPQNSSFGEQVLTTDELALPQNVLKVSRVNSIPIFRHNLNNSNILSLDVDYGSSLLNVYNLGIKIVAKTPLINFGSARVLSESDDVVLTDFFERVKEQLKDKIESKEYKEMSAIYDDVSKLLTTKGIEKVLPFDRVIRTNKNMKTDTLALFISVMLAHNLKLDINKPFLLVDNDSEAWQIQKHIFEEMKKLSTTVTIKTLPFFRLSGIRVYQKPCILLSMKNSLVGSKLEKVLAPHSGLHQIVSYRHNISTTECFSEFQMVRIPLAELPQDIPIPTSQVNKAVENFEQGLIQTHPFGKAFDDWFKKYIF